LMPNSKPAVMQNPYAMHSFLKHQAPKPPTRFHEDPEIKALPQSAVR
jgi:hypothetical protein